MIANRGLRPWGGRMFEQKSSVPLTNFKSFLKGTSGEIVYICVYIEWSIERHDSNLVFEMKIDDLKKLYVDLIVPQGSISEKNAKA